MAPEDPNSTTAADGEGAAPSGALIFIALLGVLCYRILLPIVVVGFWMRYGSRRSTWFFTVIALLWAALCVALWQEARAEADELIRQGRHAEAEQVLYEAVVLMEGGTLENAEGDLGPGQKKP